MKTKEFNKINEAIENIVNNVENKDFSTMIINVDNTKHKVSHIVKGDKNELIGALFALMDIDELIYIIICKANAVYSNYKVNELIEKLKATKKDERYTQKF